MTLYKLSIHKPGEYSKYLLVSYKSWKSIKNYLLHIKNASEVSHSGEKYLYYDNVHIKYEPIKTSTLIDIKEFLQ